MLDLLEKIAGSPAIASRTLYLPPHPAPDILKDLLKEIPADSPISEKFSEITTASPNGAVIFANSAAKYLVVPPFPIAEKILTPSPDVAPLRSQIARH